MPSGPYDDAIEAQQGVAVRGDPPEPGEEEQERRPPGGKALVRLLELLERAGYTDAAEAAVEAAIPEQARDAFLERAAQFTAAPSGKPGGRGTRGRSSRSRGRGAGVGEAREGLVPED